MPIITHIDYTPRPVLPGRVCTLTVTLGRLVPGPVSFLLELDPMLPQTFVVAGQLVRKISRTRTIPNGMLEYTTLIAFRVRENAGTPGPPIITITVSGIDGTAPPHAFALELAKTE